MEMLKAPGVHGVLGHLAPGPVEMESKGRPEPVCLCTCNPPEEPVFSCSMQAASFQL